MDVKNLDEQVNGVINLLNKEGVLQYVEKFPPWFDKEGAPHYKIILKDVDEHLLVCDEGKRGLIDKLYAYVPEDEFWDFLRRGCSCGDSLVFSSKTYRETGYNWVNDIASGTNSSSGYSDEKVSVRLKLNLENKVLKYELTWNEM